MPSSFETLYDVLSLLHQRFPLTLKSPRTTVKKWLFAKIVSRFSSKFEMFENDLEIGLLNDIKQ